jgi:hypothetical protein
MTNIITRNTESLKGQTVILEIMYVKAFKMMDITVFISIKCHKVSLSEVKGKMSYLPILRSKASALRKKGSIVL